MVNEKSIRKAEGRERELREQIREKILEDGKTR